MIGDFLKSLTKLQWFGVGIVLFVYLLLRLGWVESIMFDYDMPRVALVVQDFLRNGSFLTSQRYFEDSSWQNIPWGPAFVFYYAAFLAVSANPLTVSVLVGVFNIISVICVMIIGFRYFSSTVGIAAGLLLATHPVWVNYSRIIYQPTPVIPFIALSMLLLFLAWEKPKSIFVSLVIFSWVILIQFYLPTSSFIATSFAVLAAKFRELSKKFVLFGLFLALILVSPTILYLIENQNYVDRYFEAPSKFTPPEKSYQERFENVNKAFFENISGSITRWDIGYGYDDFYNSVPKSRNINLTLAILSGLTIIYNLFMVFKSRKNRFYRGLLLAWALCPYWFLNVVWVTDMVPRYFLLAFPAFCLLVAMSVEDLADLFTRYLPKSKVNPAWLVISLVAFYWLFFTVKYNDFIREYSYPHGRLSGIAETPLVFFQDAVRWIENDARMSNYSKFVVSNDNSQGMNDIWLETKYMMEYVVKKPEQTNEKVGYYKILHSNILNERELENYAQFGPFVAFEEKR